MGRLEEMRARFAVKDDGKTQAEEAATVAEAEAKKAELAAAIEEQRAKLAAPPAKAKPATPKDLPAFNDGWRTFTRPGGREAIVADENGIRDLGRKFVVQTERRLSDAEGGGILILDLIFRFGQYKEKKLSELAASSTTRGYLRWVHGEDFGEPARAAIRLALGEDADDIAEKHKRFSAD